MCCKKSFEVSQNSDPELADVKILPRLARLALDNKTRCDGQILMPVREDALNKSAT